MRCKSATPRMRKSFRGKTSWAEKRSGTGTGIMPKRGAPAPFGNQKTDQGHAEQEKERGRGLDFIHEDPGGYVGDQEHGNGEGENSFEKSLKCFVGHASDIEEIVVAPDDTLSFDGPETHAGEQQHQRIMDQDADHAENKEADELSSGGCQVHLPSCV